MNAPGPSDVSAPPRVRRLLVVIVLVAVAVACLGIGTRLRQRNALTAEATETAVAVVAVTRPVPGASGETLPLPADVQAWTSAPIYARTSGYLRRWYVDIGAEVKTGQLLAEIDTPEVDAQLRQARADLAVAESNSRLADATAARWQTLLASGMVARQDADDKAGDAEAKRASVASARENVHRLEELVGFRRVIAPFDGVITARSIDVGALIATGTGTGTGQQLFRLAATHRLRVYVQVPQSWAASVHVGDRAELRFNERPQHGYAATVTSTARAIDPASRTLLTELAMDNPDGLLPGSYAEVQLPVPPGPGLRVPANALLFRADGAAIATVDANDRVSIRPVRIGRDLGTVVEVLEGISDRDRVIVNPTDSMSNGTPVRIAATRG